jgi:hypothetical protein
VSSFFCMINKVRFPTSFSFPNIIYWKQLSFPHWVSWDSYWKSFDPIRGPSILFHRSIDQSSCQHYTVVITVTLCYALKSGSVRLFNFILLF